MGAPGARVPPPPPPTHKSPVPPTKIMLIKKVERSVKMSIVEDLTSRNKHLLKGEVQ